MFGNKLFYLIVLLLYFPGIKIMAQNTSPDENSSIADILEEAVSAGDEESDYSNISDEMYYFLDHPLNLNEADADELRQLNLLTEFQIFSLINYLNEHGELLSVYELQMVYGFDKQLINSLLPFITLSPKRNTKENDIRLKNPFAQRLVYTVGIDGGLKAGFVPDSSGHKEFLGKDRKINLRYEGTFSRFNFGFTLDQDAGESFKYEDHTFRPDFISSFLEYKGHRFIKKIIVGDFKVSWAQGLVMGGFGSRKGTQVLISPQSSGLKKYSSAGENDFLRGVAGSFQLKSVNTEFFASNMKIDASLHEMTLDGDSIFYFNSPDASGLHRTIAEMAKKDAVSQKSFGVRSQLYRKNTIWGISYLTQEFGHTWIYNNTAYTRDVFPAGINLHNMGSDFKLSLGKISVFSEIAADAKRSMAIFAGALAELHPLIRISLAYRNYRPEYLGLRSSGFGESQGTKNEEGFYLGLQMYPSKYLKIDVYADHYSFPFLRYNSTNPFSGNDYLLNCSIITNRDFLITMRFRYEKTQNRSPTCVTGINRMETDFKGGYRLEVNYLPNKNLKLKSRVEFSYFKMPKQAKTTGFYSAHDIGFSSTSQKHRLWLRYAIYDIPGWDNRIYAYENDLQYSFSVPAFNSGGTRFIVMGKADVLPNLELSIRYALSEFHGIKIRGSGNDKIKSGSDSYCSLQLIYKTKKLSHSRLKRKAVRAEGLK